MNVHVLWTVHVILNYYSMACAMLMQCQTVSDLSCKFFSCISHRLQSFQAVLPLTCSYDWVRMILLHGVREQADILQVYSGVFKTCFFLQQHSNLWLHEAVLIVPSPANQTARFQALYSLGFLSIYCNPYTFCSFLSSSMTSCYLTGDTFTVHMTWSSTWNPRRVMTPSDPFVILLFLLL